MKSTHLIALAALALPTLAMAQAPQYTIVDLGVVAPNAYSQAFDISSNGQYVVGRSISQTTTAWPTSLWSASTGMVGQGGLPGHNYGWGFGVNSSGVAVGWQSVAASGSGAVPTMWSGGVATQLAMPNGQTVGHAYDINDAGVAVGSVGSGTGEAGAVYNIASGTTTMISALSAEGSYMQVAQGISNTGIVVGAGVDSSGRSVALSYNLATGSMTQLVMPSYSGGFNSSLAVGVSSNGAYIVGGSGNGSQAFVWSASTGALVAQLPAASGNGSMEDVNDSGWAVGSSGGVYSNPFLFANGSTYLIGDVITNGAGWNFSTTTSASAEAIANNGSIVGTAQFNGVEHAYLMTLTTAVPEPATYALMLSGVAALAFVARRRRAVR